MKELLRKISTLKSSKRVTKWATLVTLLVVGCFTGVVYFSEKPSVEVNNGYLTINSLFYGKKIAVEKIHLDGIRPLDMNKDAGYTVKWRTNGIGLPGYRVGWMRLSNGNKALVYLTDSDGVALLPTDDYDILINTDDVTGITEALRKAANE
jgi:hypothetical protein